MDNMEHVIEHAARTIRQTREFQAGAAFGVPVDAYEDYALGVARALAEAGYLTAPVSRDDIDRALINVTSNAMNYPTPSQMLGKDSGPLRKKCVDAVCDLFGIEA